MSSLLFACSILLSSGSMWSVRLLSPYVAHGSKSFVQQSAAMQDPQPTLLLDQNHYCSFADLFFPPYPAPPADTPKLPVKHLCLFPKKQDIWGFCFHLLLFTMITKGSSVSRKIAKL